MKKTIILSAIALLVSASAFAEALRPDDRNVMPAPRQYAAAVAPEDAPEPIMELPDGEYELKNYARDSQYFYVGTTGGVFFGDDTAFAAQVAFYDNGDVYMRNPISGFVTDAWVKGSLSDGVITVEFPQSIAIEQIGDYTYYYTVNRMQYKEVVADDGSEGVDYFVVEDDNKMTFTIDETTGDISQEPDRYALDGELPDIIMGLFYNDPEYGNVWAPYGDCNQKYYTFTYEPTTLPEGLEPETWVMHYWQELGKWNQDLRMVSVAFDEDGSVYLGNLFIADMQDNYIKGTLQDGQILFPSNQYLGLNPTSNHYAFVMGCEIETYYDDAIGSNVRQLKLVQNLVMEYDEDQKALFSDMTININNGNQEIYEIKTYVEPIIRYYDLSEPAQPEEPSWVFIQDNVDEYMPFTQVWLFNIPKVDVNGMPLDPARMYYNIWYDDEPFTLYPQDYPLVAEDMFNIPYEFDNEYNVEVNGTLHQILIYFYDDYEYLSLQSVYVKEDGTELRSEINKVSSVAEIQNASEVSTEYFDLAGRRIARPDSGIVLKRVTLDDGSVRTSKELLINR